MKKTLKRLTLTAPDGSTTINADLFDGISQGEINGYLKSAPKVIVESVEELKRHEDRHKPRPLLMTKLDDYFGQCPNCEERLTANGTNFCSACGQRIEGRRLLVEYNIKYDGEYMYIKKSSSNTPRKLTAETDSKINTTLTAFTEDFYNDIVAANSAYEHGVTTDGTAAEEDAHA